MFKFTALALTAALALSSCTGPQGPAGPQGAQGVEGVQGTPGKDGASGAKGDPGTNGSNGADGTTGATGAQGPQGPTGAAGPTGLKGDTGAPGATGPQGPQGTVGPKGDPGAKGETGTANVLYSKWLDASNATLVSSVYQGGSFFNCVARFIFSDANLSPYIANSAILFYTRYFSIVESVPTILNNTYSSYYAVFTNGYRIEISEGNAANSAACETKVAGFKNDYAFRYVIIPGAQQIGPQSLNSASSLQKLPYREIQKRFGIPD